MAQLVVEVTEKGIKKVDSDLAKLGKTGASTEKSLDKTGKTSNNLSVSMKGLATTTAGVTAGMAAAGAAVAATTIAIAAQVVATDNLRRVSGLSIDQFEASAFAAQQYGLGVEQLGDAFKDTSERIGEFLSTGGGALQDFADTLGLTADETLKFANEVKDLSGKDILIRMINDLEEAEVSSKQMSFALEGMASDLTLILPLLTNNAEEFNRLSRAMSSVTMPLDESDVKQFRDLNEAVGLVGGSFNSLLTESILPLVEPMTDLANATARFLASLNEGTEAQISRDLEKVGSSLAGAFSILESNPDSQGAQQAISQLSGELLLLTDQAVRAGFKVDESFNSLLDSASAFDAIYQPINTITEQLKDLGDIEGVLTGLQGSDVNEFKDFLAENEGALAGFVSNSSVSYEQNFNNLKNHLEEQKDLLTQSLSELSNTETLTSKPLELIIKPKTDNDDNDDNGDFKLLQKQADARVEIIRQGLLTEQELKDEQLGKDIESIENSTLLEQEQAALLLGVWEEYYSDKESVAQAAADEIERQAKREAAAQEAQTRKAADAWDTMTQDLKSTLGEQNALYKASATVNATIKAYEAANSAYAALAPIPYIGPALGAAAAGVAVASGLANVAAINSSRAQGGSVGRGDVVEVGERGRELFVPETNGSIISANMLNNAGGGGGGNVYITNNTPSKVSAETDDDGNTYVKIEELDQLVGAALSNPNSESYQGLSSVASLQRS